MVCAVEKHTGDDPFVEALIKRISYPNIDDTEDEFTELVYLYENWQSKKLAE